MASRALVCGLTNGFVDAATSDFLVDVQFIVADKLEEGKAAALTTKVTLDSSVGIVAWRAAILAAVLEFAIANGFEDLVASRVFLPDYVPGA
jgi:hypothetical protein